MIVKGIGSMRAVMLVVYGVLCLHFLARMASPRHHWYVVRWRRLVVWLSAAGPLGIAAAGLLARYDTTYWLVLLSVALVGSVGVWLAVGEISQRTG